MWLDWSAIVVHFAAKILAFLDGSVLLKVLEKTHFTMVSQDDCFHLTQNGWLDSSR
jgi:hypothetical protein